MHDRSPPSSWTQPAWRRSTHAFGACVLATLSVWAISCAWGIYRGTGVQAAAYYLHEFTGFPYIYMPPG